MSVVDYKKTVRNNNNLNFVIKSYLHFKQT